MWKSETSPVRTPGEQGLVLDALQCVKLLRGGFGRHAVASVLIGSQRDLIMRHELHELEVYGKHRDLKRRYIIEVLDCLRDQGLLTYRGGNRRNCVLTERGRKVLKTRKTSDVLVPARPCDREKDMSSYTGRYDIDLYERLKRIQGELAAIHNRPSHVLVEKNSLRAVARFLPETLEELRLLKGFGDGTTALVGKELVEEVRLHLGWARSRKDPGFRESRPGSGLRAAV